MVHTENWVWFIFLYILKETIYSNSHNHVTLWFVPTWPGSSVHGILQVRILAWEAIPSSQPRSPTLQADSLPFEPPGKPNITLTLSETHSPWEPYLQSILSRWYAEYLQLTPPDSLCFSSLLWPQGGQPLWTIPATSHTYWLSVGLNKQEFERNR